MNNLTFNIITLGCKVNSYESEALINDLTNKGWLFKEDTNVDVVIINTCTVTSTSDQKSRQMISRVRRKYPNAIVVAMGCYVQLNPISASKLADIVIGTTNRLQVYDLVNNFLYNKKCLNAINDVQDNPSYEEMKVNSLKTHTRGFVKIQDGCENYCSYCAIPYARGKIRSRKPEDVIDEITSLVNHGTKEVIISGINTGCYGKDLGNICLATLIENIMQETNLYRLRLSSIELMEVTDELLMVIKKYEDRIANHLHIPLQAGSDTVLKRMHRKYLTNDYRLLIQKIRTIFPNIAITTDCLAGFVGETPEEFNEAYAFIKEMNFAMMHIFPYSRRKNTEADKMSNHLDPQIINERAHKLQLLAKSMQLAYMEKFIGTTQLVITETVKNNCFTSHSSNYLEINIPCDESSLWITENMIVKVKIEKIIDDTIYGKGEKNE